MLSSDETPFLTKSLHGSLRPFLLKLQEWLNCNGGSKSAVAYVSWVLAPGCIVLVVGFVNLFYQHYFYPKYMFLRQQERKVSVWFSGLSWWKGHSLCQSPFPIQWMFSYAGKVGKFLKKKIKYKKWVWSSLCASHKHMPLLLLLHIYF